MSQSSQFSSPAVVASGKRKKAIARAVVRAGEGRITFNGYPIELHPNLRVRAQLEVFRQATVPFSQKVDVELAASGGGYMGQYQASIYAMSRAMYKFFGQDDQLKKVLLEFDPHALSGDPREKEPKKYGGKGARRRFQKSYR